MVYRKKVKIKGQEYWYLFHTVRDGNKFTKKSKYLGKELPKNIKEIEEEFEKEIHGQESVIKEKPVSEDDKIIEFLHPLEKKVIPFLKFKDAKNISEKSKLKEIEVLRALQWLENKKLIGIKKEEEKIVNLGANGSKYVKDKLPEKRFLDNLDKPLAMQELMKKTKLEKDEFTFCLGYLKKNNLIQIGKEITRIKDKFDDINNKQKFLESLPKSLEELDEKDKKIFLDLKDRKELIRVDKEKNIIAELTKLGEKISRKDINLNLIENLTTEMLAKKSWKNKKFRRYNVSLEVPKVYAGKRHFVNQAIDYAKRIWTDMGFEEMTGEIINESFWNFDALFTPQDHPARELQDSIFLDRKVEIKDKELLNKIKEMHENGAGISKGWQYKWDEEKAKKLVMRTHTTVLSAKTLARLKDKKGKFFAIGRNFRNEAVDWSHGFEFNQTEGIVIDPDANFRHLLGYLKEFFKKMGFPQARFRPAYFP
ncbi:phenylalanine--tRNA ligase subunit alpha [Candidatus Woesearchaeota archaeon]|nr:phenylalanine--tRNA ligase subunit alpha [Candidatus Woesearchaeota archaeon]